MANLEKGTGDLYHPAHEGNAVVYTFLRKEGKLGEDAVRNGADLDTIVDNYFRPPHKDSHGKAEPNFYTVDPSDAETLRMLHPDERGLVDGVGVEDVAGEIRANRTTCRQHLEREKDDGDSVVDIYDKLQS